MVMRVDFGGEGLFDVMLRFDWLGLALRGPLPGVREGSYWYRILVGGGCMILRFDWLGFKKIVCRGRLTEVYGFGYVSTVSMSRFDLVWVV